VKHKTVTISLIIAALVILFLSLLNPGKAWADSYSNGGSKTITIDKKLRAIEDSKYVDNIASSTKTFFEGDLIEFKIRVENTGDGVLKNIQVVDNLPPFFKLVLFPGTYDQTNNKVLWTIGQLNAGDAQEFIVRGKINQATHVTELTKETNVAESCVDGICDKDDATYYIGGISVPETGASDLIVKTGILISLGLAGVFARKYARGY